MKLDRVVGAQLIAPSIGRYQLRPYNLSKVEKASKFGMAKGINIFLNVL